MTNNIELESGNGRFFQNWLLKTFKEYKLPEIFIKEGEDSCSIGTKNEIKKYQDFVSHYMDRANQSSILLYHGLGSGKTHTAINIYNVLYHHTPDWNVFLLIKSALHDEWISELNKWLKDKKMIDNVHFINYDSPTADKNFIEVKKKVDNTKKMIYYIDEVHNFIKNVYSNITSQKGGRAQAIYDYIYKEKKNDSTVKIITISATPLVNEPFELALLFNLLRPNSFPSKEIDFYQLYIANNTLNTKMINMFQRRIVGLVSYYVGATPDYYATKKVNYVNLPMSAYQTKVYSFFEKIEDDANKKQLRFKQKKQSGTYMTYTRQACNFVFPEINDTVNGVSRPRPSKFNISEKEADALEKGKEVEKTNSVNKYNQVLLLYIVKLKEYFDAFKNNLNDDLEKFREYYNPEENSFETFLVAHKNKSELFEKMYELSPKFLAICFYISICKGSTMVYSNYVRLEGLEILKIYLAYFGFTSADDSTKTKYKFCEFHGGVDKITKTKHKEIFNSVENKYGEIIKLILISPSGTEGLNLRNVLQVHLVEPYWNEVRMDQMIGRAIRQCSHKDLPLEERKVMVFRYKVMKEGSLTTDYIIENISFTKNNINQNFLNTLKQVAVDCQLFRNHNMLGQSYKCFQFAENTLFTKNPGPIYKQNLKEDLKLNNGLNSETATSQKIKVRKVKVVYSNADGTYSEPNECWINDLTGIVYDYDLYFPTGKILYENEIPMQLSKNVYIISQDLDKYY